jgi:hypothetical protein
MRLTDVAGQVIELEVVGYEFPDDASKQAARERARQGGIIGTVVGRDRNDDNWLVIRGHVETARGAWDFLAPCLETWEARELCDWLQVVSSGQPRGAINFLEPNIAFESATPEPDRGRVRVVANFALESRPPWSERFDFDELIEFVFTESELRTGASSLSQSLNRFPER